MKLIHSSEVQAISLKLASKNKMRLLPLIGATYFMVAGGPYGLEDIIGKAGYIHALILLAIVPFIWSLPTALMVGELASSIPDEGGFYVWVYRALGPFWGFQEAWLSLAASVFDMAIYPVTFVLYLSRVAPSLTSGHRGIAWELAVVLGCMAWNLKGAKAVGQSAVGMFAVLLTPFIILVIVALWRWHGHGTGALLQPITNADMGGALAVTLWNYMGWDNASTVAQEVDNPQKNYPRAMLGSAGLVAVTYILPLLAVALAGLAATQFNSDANGGTGTWTDAARTIVGPALGLAVVVGGMINGVGMFNPLMMSYTRLPPAMARDHLLPRIMGHVNRFGVPSVSVIACAVMWALALGLTFERLISIDLILYGSSLILEFVALIVLRRREPDLARPFRVPGGFAGAIAVGICPLLLIIYASWTARSEQVLGLPALIFAAIVAIAGGAIFFIAELFRRRASSTSTQ